MTALAISAFGVAFGLGVLAVHSALARIADALERVAAAEERSATMHERVFGQRDGEDDT